MRPVASGRTTRRTMRTHLLAALLSTSLIPAQDPDPNPAQTEEQAWVVFEGGGDGPGRGRHIVFVTGDEEYRSEEGMPQLAKILAVRHGFRCTVLFAVDPETGEIAPGVQDNIPGLEALKDADLMVLFTRFRALPDQQMGHIVNYVESGRPIVGLRTATHAFRYQKTAKYDRYSTGSADWKGGFGRQVLGETWIAHHGGHKSQSSRGLPVDGEAEHPILRGISAGDVWDPSDVYRVRLPMVDGVRPLLLGQVLAGMSPDDPPAPAEAGRVDKNDPMMPIAWVRTWKTPKGQRARVFATTLGSAQAFTREGTRRLLVNACLWAIGMEDRIEPDLDVDLVGEFRPSEFGFNSHESGVRPASHRLESDRR